MKVDLLNGLGLLAAVGLAMGAALAVGDRPEPVAAPGPDAPVAETGPLTDGRGNTVPPAAYQRIVSLNPVADFLLLELVEPARLLGVSSWSLDQHPDGWRFAGTAAIDSAGQVESVLALKPDLVVISRFVDDSRMERIREEGIPVLDLGDMRGVDSTLDDIAALSRLVDEPDRGRRLAARVRSQVDGLSSRAAALEWPSAVYLSLYGDTFFGGTADTSYADLLRLAGLHDLAAEHGHTGWPQYSAEQILEMNPPLLITQDGMAEALCGHPVVSQVRACGPEGRVVELRGAYHSDPGLGLLHAAEDLQQQVHGP